MGSTLTLGIESWTGVSTCFHRAIDKEAIYRDVRTCPCAWWVPSPSSPTFAGLAGSSSGSPLPPGQAALRCSHHRPNRQEVQRRTSRAEEEEDFKQLSHIFKKKEPGIAFVSQGIKASVPPTIRKPSCGESIQAQLHSWKLGAGSPQRAIAGGLRAWLEAAPKGWEGPEGRGLDSTVQHFLPHFTLRRAPHKSSELRPSAWRLCPWQRVLAERRASPPRPPPASPRLHFIFQCARSGPQPGDLFLMSEIKGLAMSGTLPPSILL